MSTKDYKKIAGVFRDQLSRADCFDETRAIEVVAEQLCKVFSEDNPKFKRDLFLTACGHSSYEQKDSLLRS